MVSRRRNCDLMIVEFSLPSHIYRSNSLGPSSETTYRCLSKLEPTKLGLYGSETAGRDRCFDFDPRHLSSYSSMVFKFKQKRHGPNMTRKDFKASNLRDVSNDFPSHGCVECLHFEMMMSLIIEKLSLFCSWLLKMLATIFQCRRI